MLRYLMTQWRMDVKAQRIFSPDKIFTASKSLKFRSACKNFGGCKKSFALKMASRWQIFFCKTNKISRSALSHWCCLHLRANCNSQFRFLSDVFSGNEGIRAWGIKGVQCAEHISWTELLKCKLKRPGVSVGHNCWFSLSRNEKIKIKTTG